LCVKNNISALYSFVKCQCFIWCLKITRVVENTTSEILLFTPISIAKHQQTLLLLVIKFFLCHTSKGCMENFEPINTNAMAFNELVCSLFALRDSFLTLSLALKDWQFETDSVQRLKAEALVQQLLDKMSLPRRSSF